MGGAQGSALPISHSRYVRCSGRSHRLASNSPSRGRRSRACGHSRGTVRSPHRLPAMKAAPSDPAARKRRSITRRTRSRRPNTPSSVTRRLRRAERPIHDVIDQPLGLAWHHCCLSPYVPTTHPRRLMTSRGSPPPCSKIVRADRADTRQRWADVSKFQARCPAFARSPSSR